MKLLNLRTLTLAAMLLALAAAAHAGGGMGTRLPDIEVNSLSGDPIRIHPGGGEPLLVIFWNSWCANCRRELPALAESLQSMEPGSLRVLAVNTGINDAREKALGYWKRSGFPFPSGYDEGFRLTTDMAVMGVPLILLVDAEGVVRYRQASLPEDLEARVKQLKRPRPGG